MRTSRECVVDTFQFLCKAVCLPEPVPEFRFAPPRRWRLDWAWPEHKIGIEVQGGIFSAGRHVRGAALLKEYEKLNALALRGWRVVYLTPQQFSAGDGVKLVQEMIRQTLEAAK